MRNLFLIFSIAAIAACSDAKKKGNNETENPNSVENVTENSGENIPPIRI